MATLTLYVDNDMLVTLKGVRDRRTQVAITDAVFTAEVRDAAGTVVTGLDAISGVYRSGSNGDYDFLIPATAQVVATAEWLMDISCSNYGIAFNNIKLLGKYRGA